MIDPADAIEALLDELKRQRAAGVTRVSVSTESMEFLRKVTASARPAVSPAAVTAGASPVAAFTASAQAARPVTPARPTPAPVTAAPVIPIPDPPVVTLPDIFMVAMQLVHKYVRTTGCSRKKAPSRH